MQNRVADALIYKYLLSEKKISVDMDGPRATSEGICQYPRSEESERGEWRARCEAARSPVALGAATWYACMRGAVPAVRAWSVWPACGGRLIVCPPRPGPSTTPRECLVCLQGSRGIPSYRLDPLWGSARSVLIWSLVMEARSRGVIAVSATV